jgi:Tol biopolymer transport system component
VLVNRLTRAIRLIASLSLVLAVPSSPSYSATVAASVFPGKNGKIAFAGRGSNIDPRLTVVNPDGTGLKHLTRNGESCPSVRCGGRTPAWSPDGKHLAFAKTYSHSGIYVMRSDGTHARKVEDRRGAEYPRWPTWSPDGAKIAFSGFTDGIFVVNLDGNGLRLVHRPKKGAFDDSLDWSPDGKRLTFTEVSDFGGAQIYVMKPDGTSITRLTSGPSANLDPTWSPGGTAIAFLSIGKKEGERCSRRYAVMTMKVMTMNPDGSGKKKIADIKLPCVPEGLTWSPDGTKLAFIAQQFPGSDTPWIFTMNSDGTQRHAIVEGDGRLNWQSLPR